MSCCGGTCSCGCGMCLSFTENTSSIPESMVLGVAPEKGAGEAAPEKASESAEAGQGCCCGSGCTCSPCSC